MVWRERRWVIEAVRYGGSVLVGGGRGARDGVAGAGGFAGARRGGPGTGGAADAFGLDGGGDRRSVRGGGRLGAALAGVVRARRRGRAALDAGAGSLARTGRAGAGLRARGSGRAGARPAE